MSTPAKSTFLVTAFLAALSALPPLSIDMGLASMPNLEAAFENASGKGAMTLSLFLLGFSMSPLAAGPLSDRYGRRPVLLAGAALFAVFALWAGMTENFSTLLIARLVQGIGAGAIVTLPLAIIADMSKGSDARSQMAAVTSIQGIAPMIAPLVGGALVVWFSWRSVFIVQGFLSIAFLVAGLFFAETLPEDKRRSLKPADLFATWGEILKNRQFLTYVLAFSFGFATMFTWISASSSVLMEDYGLSTTQYTVAFTFTSFGVMAGAILSGKAARLGISAERLVLGSLLGMAVVVGLGLVLLMSGVLPLWMLLACIFCLTFCFGLAAPASNISAIADLGRMAGSASGVIRCIQMLLGALMSGLVVLGEGWGSGPMVMLGLMLGCVVAGVLCFLGFGHNQQLQEA